MICLILAATGLTSITFSSCLDGCEIEVARSTIWERFLNELNTCPILTQEVSNPACPFFLYDRIYHFYSFSLSFRSFLSFLCFHSFVSCTRLYILAWLAYACFSWRDTWRHASGICSGTFSRPTHTRVCLPLCSPPTSGKVLASKAHHTVHYIASEVSHCLSWAVHTWQRREDSRFCMFYYQFRTRAGRLRDISLDKVWKTFYYHKHLKEITCKRNVNKVIIIYRNFNICR